MKARKLKNTKSIMADNKNVEENYMLQSNRVYRPDITKRNSRLESVKLGKLVKKITKV